MSEKEATVYIVDVGRSTVDTRDDDSQTNLERALSYIWDRITSIIALERKTTLQAVITVRSDDTLNELSDDPSYSNIAVLQNLKALSLQDLNDLQNKISPSKTSSGDAISAIVVAISLIEQTCKKLKYIRRIVLVTSGDGVWSGDDIHEISQKISGDRIQLTILDMGANSSSIKQEKASILSENQRFMQQLAKESEGTCRSLEDSIEEMTIPKLKNTRPVPSFKGRLCLGDPAQYDDALMIDIERYPRTMLRKPQTATSLFERLDSAPDGSTQTLATPQTGEMDVDVDRGDGALGMVRGSRTYEVSDASLSNGKLTVALEDLAKGYEYGRTAVSVGESDFSLLKMEASSAFEIVGFVPSENYEHYMSLSKSNVIIAQRANNKAAMALSSFIKALKEVSSMAIARLVVKDDKAPILVLLAPVSEDSGLEYLIDVELPFAEDVRHYQFPPLDHVLTVSGKVLKEHRNIPGPSLQSAMDAYVDSMDIDNFTSNDSWNPAEYVSLNDSFSPVLHHIDSAIRFRAINPDAKPPTVNSILTKYSEPKADLVADEVLKKLKDVSDVKKVPPKTKARHFREAATPLSGLDVAGLISSRKKKKNAPPTVDPENPIPSFRQMLEDTRDPNGINDAARQFGAIIESHASSGFGESHYPKVCEEMKVLRDELVEMEEPGIWNEWVRQFKKKLVTEQLGGDLTELWWQIRGDNIGLISGDLTDVTDDEVVAFMRMKL